MTSSFLRNKVFNFLRYSLLLKSTPFFLFYILHRINLSNYFLIKLKGSFNGLLAIGFGKRLYLLLELCQFFNLEKKQHIVLMFNLCTVFYFSLAQNFIHMGLGNTRK